MRATDLLDRALLLSELRRPAEAEQALRELVALEPWNALAHANLALVLLDLERDRDAETCARAAVALDPELPFAYSALARSRARQERFEEAIAAIREAIRLDPDDHLDHELLAACLYSLGDGRGARESARRALALAPGSATAHGLLAVASTDPEERQAFAAAAVTTDPESSVAHALAAHAHFSGGHFREAEVGFAEALRLDPENDFAQVGLRTIRNPVRPLVGIALTLAVLLVVRVLLVFGAFLKWIFAVVACVVAAGGLLVFLRLTRRKH